jgi:hypothetical protein
MPRGRTPNDDRYMARIMITLRGVGIDSRYVNSDLGFCRSVLTKEFVFTAFFN